MNYISNDSWTILSPIEQSIKEKIEKVGIPLKDWDININYGIKTGLNEAFIISREIKETLISKDQKSAEIIRPILRGRDIKRYGYDFADLWVINTHNGDKTKKIPPVNICDSPAIKAHLAQYYEKLAKRADKGVTPYNMRNCAYMDDFNKPKIIWGNLCLTSQFTYTEEPFIINAPSPMITVGTKYLVAILNSKLADWYIRQLGITRNGGYFEYKPMFVEKMPIPVIEKDNEKPFNDLVDLIMKSNSKEEYERKINELVYSLYNLSTQEIYYIESTVDSI